MKKRLVLTSLSLFSLFSLIVSVISFSYAWLNKIPEYQFTLSTGDYPLIVTTNLYTTHFAYANRQVSIDGSTNVNLDYENQQLRLTKERFKSYDFSSNTPSYGPDNKSYNISSDSGTLNIEFGAVTNNIINNDKSELSIIGNSTNGYQLNNKYFYVAFIEFLFYKEFFDAYLICKPQINKQETETETKPDYSVFFKFSFLESEQTISDNYCASSFIKQLDDETVTLNNPSSDIDFSEDSLFASTASELMSINDGNNQSRHVNSLSVKDTSNNLCYSYAAIYGIYLDPSIYFESIKQQGISALTNIDLSLSFDFTLTDNIISI